MTLKREEDATNFLERITETKITLNGLGQDHIDEEIFSLGRLRAGILQDPRYATLATTLTCIPNLTWEQACAATRAFDKTNVKTVPKTDAKKPEESIRLLKEKHQKKVKHLQAKLKNQKGYCKYCKINGHVIDNCKKLKAKKEAENIDIKN